MFYLVAVKRHKNELPIVRGAATLIEAAKLYADCHVSAEVLNNKYTSAEAIVFDSETLQIVYRKKRQ